LFLSWAGFAQFHISPNCKEKAYLTSYHCGRHSFATIALTNGMPIESVSRVLGHTNITTTQIYAKITSQKLNNDLTMLGDKLNASFSNI
jgi:site-specific recombinase XerD